MDLIEKIGPFVGLAAFVALAVLAFLLFQQSRDLRRLREWAGRAPERAKEAADASLAAAELRGEETESEGPGRISRGWTAVKDWVAPATRPSTAICRSTGASSWACWPPESSRPPCSPAASAWSASDDKGGGKKAQAAKQDEKPKVAVLNATQTDEVQGVPGLADKVASEVLKQLGYPIGAKTNAPTGFAETVVMYESGFEGDAAELARGVAKQLGETETEEMAADIRESAGDAKLALVVGADDAQF